MRKLLKRPHALACLLAALYLFGLVLSICTISIYPLLRQKRFLVLHAREVAQRWLASGDTFELWTDGKTRIVIYDAQGRRLEDRSSDPKEPPRVHHEEYLSEVLSGNETFKATFEYGPGSLLHGLMGVAGTPIVVDGVVTGAAFYIRKIIAVTESLAGYAIYFTVLYWLSAWFIVSSIKKKQKLEVMRQNYIANVTHALKTPIASVRMLSEALCDGVITDPVKQKVYFGLILQETTNQNRMVQEMLELSKVQSQDMDLTKSAVSAAEILAPVTEKYSMLCDCTDVALHIDDSVYSLPTLYTNAACIRQVLQILLDNATKYVPSGGNVTISASLSNHTATVCVRDDGDGIAPEFLPHVFDRFYKCNKGDSMKGSGLGLAIAREMLGGLGEKIRVDSELGQGTAFFFTVRTK